MQHNNIYFLYDSQIGIDILGTYIKSMVNLIQNRNKTLQIIFKTKEKL